MYDIIYVNSVPNKSCINLFTLDLYIFGATQILLKAFSAFIVSQLQTNILYWYLGKGMLLWNIQITGNWGILLMNAENPLY